MEKDQSIFECWAIVEIFGHQQLAGKVTEQTIAGQGFIRVDVPELPDLAGFTRLFGPGAIYSIIPTTEEIATAYAARNVEAPIKAWQLQRPQLRAPIEEMIDNGEMERDDDDDIDDSDTDDYDPSANRDDEPPF